MPKLSKKNKNLKFKSRNKSNSKSKSKMKTQRGGVSKSKNYIPTRNFSTGDIKNKKIKAIVHVTEATGINVVRGIGTGFANLFGKKGFESTLYDNVKTNAFKKLYQQVPDKYSVGNIKMDIETTQSTIFCHLIGTVYEN